MASLNDIWNRVYFDHGSDTSGQILTFLDDQPIGDYEITNNAIEIGVYKKAYEGDENFDNIVINESIQTALKESDLDNALEIKLVFLK